VHHRPSEKEEKGGHGGLKPKEDKTWGNAMPENALNLSGIHLDEDEKQAISHNLKFVPLTNLVEIVMGADLRRFERNLRNREFLHERPSNLFQNQEPPRKTLAL
jgi:hypothetical protein